ncbi:MAG: YggS family pyridoxal phosphate-dependent enzyme [Syntrophales bacterium]|nr:YggS family pyridoxal phosphate-dependent enzyme [Syntrophales bacterium]
MSKESPIKENVAQIRKRICEAACRAGRDPGEVKLMAVTKTVSPDRVLEAIEAGVDLLGESYVQEARAKISSLGRVRPWHLVGHLQTNKAKYAVAMFDMIHSIDRIEIAQALHERCLKEGRKLDVLIEVNVSGEVTKWGVSPDGLIKLIKDVSHLKTLSVKGLMTMAPWFQDPEKARPIFATLRCLSEQVDKENIEGVEMKELSMGMSDDFEVAVEEGATIVRIGRAIFGERT